MKIFTVFLFVFMLIGCGKQPEPTETVESLVAEPELLQELHRRCQTEREKLGAELCDVVAEAARQRFMGDGKVPYTPPEEKPVF